MKLYLVIEKDDGGAGLWGEYVSLCGIYTDEKLAKMRLEVVKSGLDEHGYAIDNQDEDGFIDYTHYKHEIITVNADQPISEFLGGYAE